MALLSAAQIQQARQSGYTDTEIVTYIASMRPDLAEKLQEAAREGYTPSEVVSFLLRVDRDSCSGTTPQKAPVSDRIAVLDEVEPSLRPQVEALAKVLCASVDMAIPSGAPDPRLPGGGMSWKQWTRRQLDRIFREGWRTADQMATLQAREEAERKTWLEMQRKIQRAWARWMRWRRQSPQMADAYRREHQDADGGDESWLVGFASVRVPRAQIGRQDYEKSKKKGVGL